MHKKEYKSISELIESFYILGQKSTYRHNLLPMAPYKQAEGNKLILDVKNSGISEHLGIRFCDFFPITEEDLFKTDSQEYRESKYFIIEDQSNRKLYCGITNARKEIGKFKKPMFYESISGLKPEKGEKTFFTADLKPGNSVNSSLWFLLLKSEGKEAFTAYELDDLNDFEEYPNKIRTENKLYNSKFSLIGKEKLEDYKKSAVDFYNNKLFILEDYQRVTVRGVDNALKVLDMNLDLNPIIYESNNSIDTILNK